MRKYEKPCLEVIELRPEERLARSSVTADDFQFSVLDDKDFFDGSWDVMKITHKSGRSELGFKVSDSMLRARGADLLKYLKTLFGL